ncbi:MAG: adenylosuccinate synthase [Bacteroidales bacterium]|jgi:adenylosuccinate synthase|nr:adenylosuccinate synthase [Bacteroidales bacterium]
MTNIDILLGLQWGDEGKGKVVDLLARDYDVITRFQGGPNAGHSIEFNGLKHVLHIIPSGIFHRDKINLIGNGVVLDPVIFKEEIRALETMGLTPADNLLVSDKAHLILPTHRLLDAAQETRKGASKIGSTLKGIGPAYTDKTGRAGLRVGDILTPSFKEKYDSLKNNHLKQLATLEFDVQSQLDTMEKEWLASLETLKTFNVVSAEYVLHDYFMSGKRVLAEGAQGTLLDVDFGSYPFVTSSNTIAAGTFTGLGVAPGRTGRVYGIVKAYCTRVGSGPFPTELHDDTGDLLREKGAEFGATTGRPRRCGWLDLVALKYAVMLNGVTDIVLTKADVLSGFDEIKVCDAYLMQGKPHTRMPFEQNVPITPRYRTFRGWTENITPCKEYSELPEALKEYISFIEQETCTRVSIVSVGPDRVETIKRV